MVEGLALSIKALKSMSKSMTLIELTEKPRHEIFERRMREAYDKRTKGAENKMTERPNVGRTMAGEQPSQAVQNTEDEAHALFSKVGAGVAELLTQKRVCYGDSYGLSTHILSLLYPRGITTLDYGNLLAILRIIEKLFRAAKGSDPDGESPFLDIAGYAMLVLAKEERDRQPIKT